MEEENKRYHFRITTVCVQGLETLQDRGLSHGNLHIGNILIRSNCYPKQLLRDGIKNNQQLSDQMTFGKPLLSPTLDAMPPGCPDLVSEYWLQCNKNIENIEHPDSRDSPAIPPLLNRYKVWASLSFFPSVKVPIVPLVKIFDDLLFGNFLKKCLESFRRYLDF